MRPFLLSILASSILLTASQGTKQSGPEENLPPNITRLSHFGERASWSPDGKRVAFLEKSFGDAYEIDLSIEDHPSADALCASGISARAVSAKRRLFLDRRAHVH